MSTEKSKYYALLLLEIKSHHQPLCCGNIMQTLFPSGDVRSLLVCEFQLYISHCSAYPFVNVSWLSRNTKTLRTSNGFFIWIFLGFVTIPFCDHFLPLINHGWWEGGIELDESRFHATRSRFRQLVAALPGDITASKRYWSADIIEPEVTVSKQGTIRVPNAPGIGFAPRVDLIEKLTVRKEVLARSDQRR